MKAYIIFGVLFDSNVHSVSTLLGIYLTYWCSAAVDYPLRGLVHCVLRDVVLHTTVVMHGYLRYCHLLVSIALLL